VKDPTLPDTLYITELTVANVVNTMPEKTLEATFDHGVIDGDQVTSKYDDANAVLDALDAQGISYEEVTALLEKEGVEKFIVSWNELLDTVTAALESAQSGTAETESAKSGSDHTVSTEAEAAK
jgi:transaldolase